MVQGGGGWLEPKSQKLSCQSSVLADKIQRASILCRGDLGGAREAKLREGGGGSLAGMQSGIWFYSPVSFPIPSLFPNPLLLLPSLIIHSHPLRSSSGLCTDGMWWWVVVEEKKLVAVHSSHAITSRTYSVFNSISGYLPQKLLKLFRIFKYILYTYILECL